MNFCTSKGSTLHGWFGSNHRGMERPLLGESRRSGMLKIENWIIPYFRTLESLEFCQILIEILYTFLLFRVPEWEFMAKLQPIIISICHLFVQNSIKAFVFTIFILYFKKEMPYRYDWVIDCPLSKGNQSRFERPNGESTKSNFFLKSVKN